MSAGSLVGVTTILSDNDLELHPTKGSDEFIGFGVQYENERIGTVALAPAAGKQGRREGSIRWNFRAGPGALVASRALRLAIDHAFETLGWTRVEARIEDGDALDLRTASIAGLRKEGVARQVEGQADRIIVARLSSDAATFSKQGFVAILNAGLPRKRVIGQGLLRDRDGRYLLCQLTYKPEWDLPGGVVENGESPAVGLVREIEEELGVEVTVHGLVTMNWLPAWRAWDDACLFVFDLGHTDAAWIETMVLQRTEIEAVHWCDLATAREHATGATIELLEAFEAGELTGYREAPLQPE